MCPCVKGGAPWLSPEREIRVRELCASVRICIHPCLRPSDGSFLCLTRRIAPALPIPYPSPNPYPYPYPYPYTPQVRL